MHSVAFLANLPFSRFEGSTAAFTLVEFLLLVQSCVIKTQKTLTWRSLTASRMLSRQKNELDEKFILFLQRMPRPSSIIVRGIGVDARWPQSGPVVFHGQKQKRLVR